MRPGNRWLLLDGNDLEGGVPASLARAAGLERLWLLGNPRLEKDLPDEVWQLPALRTVGLETPWPDC